MTEIEFENEMSLEQQANRKRISKVVRIWPLVVIYIRLKTLPARISAILVKVVRRIKSAVPSLIAMLLRNFKR